MKKDIMHFKAFTIMEVIIALLVSALVVALAMTFYFLSISSYHRLQNQLNHENQCDLLSLQLQRDIAHAQTIYYSETELMLKTPLDSMLYKKTKQGYLKNEDTIYCTEDMNFFDYILKETMIRPIKISRYGNQN